MLIIQRILLHFNSIKVQLKLDCFEDIQAIIDDFNSIKVQLKR